VSAFGKISIGADAGGGGMTVVTNNSPP